MLTCSVLTRQRRGCVYTVPSDRRDKFRARSASTAVTADLLTWQAPAWTTHINFTLMVRIGRYHTEVFAVTSQPLKNLSASLATSTLPRCFSAAA